MPTIGVVIFSEEKMKHIVNFSGGKDSTALLLWARENLPEFEGVFCDTGWEHPITYAYVMEVGQKLCGGNLRILRSEKYAGFEDLVLKRGIVPGIRSRFCTQELKLFPLHCYYETIDDEITVYVGIRSDESRKRAQMLPRQWTNEGGGYWVDFPLFTWTAKQCFDLMDKYQVPPNPLYKMGMGRVGCWPCVMVNKRELRQAFLRFPELKDQLVRLESKLNEGRTLEDYSTFFRADYIPERYCSLTIKTKDGRLVKCPTAADVYDYLTWTDPRQLTLIDTPTPHCMSIYNLCE